VTSRATRDGALDSVTVLDLGAMGPGARASRILADYGARVVRIDPPRRLGSIELPYYAYGAMRNIDRCRVDLKHDEGKAIALELATKADVIIEGFRPGVADRIGVGYDAIKATNPRVVYCAATGYGQSGPYSNWVGHDLNYLAVGGFLSTSGRNELGVPALPGSTIADAAGGGMHAAMAIMAALLRRVSTGEGTYLDVSATEGVLGLMAMNIDEQLATGVVPGPGHGVLTGRYACYGVYECLDGRCVALGAIETKFFNNLCREMGLSEWTSKQYDDDAQAELAQVLRSTFAQRVRDEWVALLANAETCLTPVLSVDEFLHDPQIAARGLLSEAAAPGGESFAQLGPVWAGTARPREPYVLAEEGASVAVSLLEELNYPRARIDDLLARGVVE
jgi:alpha-methylacyl-CoA racemase